MSALLKEIAKESGEEHSLQVAMAVNSIDLNELIKKVESLEKHWVGKFLVKAYVSCYRGKKSPVDLSQFVNLDAGNQDLFIKILNMRNGWPYTDEQLYLTDIAPPITASEGGNNQGCVFTTLVRKLTPIECERLQGMPDNHTRISWRGKSEEDCPDGPRYKAIGNSMAVPVMKWIGQRIELVINQK